MISALVNGVQGDPGLYCFSPRTGEGLLFDAGTLDILSNRDLLKVRHFFITHTHIDHFIGFDRIVRINIPHGRSLHFYGPPGFAKNIQGKLRGYLWNLLEPGQLNYRVTEIDSTGTISAFQMTNTDDFNLHPVAHQPILSSFVDAAIPQAPAAPLTQLADNGRVEAIVLDHGTPVVGYCIQGPKRFHLKKDAAAHLGLAPGPWISELQRSLATQPEDSRYEIAGQVSTLKALSERLFDWSMDRPIGYLTDICFSRSNLDRIAQTMTGVDLLYCEATFKDADHGRAFAKKHLTTRQAALIARLLKAKELKIFHISNIYSGDHESSLNESAGFFADLASKEDQEVHRAIDAELRRSAAVS